jgi:MOSC domain-containing protein YiiM
MTMPQITSIQVGLPQTYGEESTGSQRDKPWTTAFFKQPIKGPVEVNLENLAGDGQADRRVHGGIDKAVLAYSADHYRSWEAELGFELPPGAFGENLTAAGLCENEVCLGDVWLIGSVRLEVSQPRLPCWKLARHWQHKLLPKLVVQTGRSGWYLRVITTGVIEAGMPIELQERRYPQWTIARANRAMYQSDTDSSISATDFMELASLPEVSAAWIKSLPA